MEIGRDRESWHSPQEYRFQPIPAQRAPEKNAGILFQMLNYDANVETLASFAFISGPSVSRAALVSEA